MPIILNQRLNLTVIFIAMLGIGRNKNLPRIIITLPLIFDKDLRIHSPSFKSLLPGQRNIVVAY